MIMLEKICGIIATNVDFYCNDWCMMCDGGCQTYRAFNELRRRKSPLERVKKWVKSRLARVHIGPQRDAHTHKKTAKIAFDYQTGSDYFYACSDWVVQLFAIRSAPKNASHAIKNAIGALGAHHFPFFARGKKKINNGSIFF